MRNQEGTATSRLQQLLEYYRLDPGDEFTRFAIASEYLRMGDRPHARTFLEGLVRDSPDYVGTYLHLGKLYEDVGERDLAGETYRLGIDVAARLRDDHARSELQAALMEMELGDEW